MIGCFFPPSPDPPYPVTPSHVTTSPVTTQEPDVRKCLDVCSMLLSLRSLTTVLAFFADKQRRDTVYNFRALLSTCWRWIQGTCARRCGIDRPALADRIAFADELEDVQEFHPQSTSTLRNIRRPRR